jgi:hypothetical protein
MSFAKIKTLKNFMESDIENLMKLTEAKMP